MGRQLRGSIMLFMTALIWGTAFVAQKSGMDTMSPIAFNGIRTLIGGIALLPVIYIMTRVAKKKGTYRRETPQERKTRVRTARQVEVPQVMITSCAR